MAATRSALPCPNGCRLSGGRFDILMLISTMTELMESDKVCQASTIIAIEPLTIPAQYFRTNRSVLVTIETHPAREAILFLFVIT